MISMAREPSNRQKWAMVDLLMSYGMDEAEAKATGAFLKTHEAMLELADWMEAGDFKQSLPELYGQIGFVMRQHHGRN